MLHSIVSVGPHLSRCRCLGCDGIHSLSLSATLTSRTPHTRNRLSHTVLHGDSHRYRVLSGLPAHVLGGVLETRVLGSTEGEAAVGAAVPAKRIVAASELACHLLVGGSPAGYQHDVEPCEAADREEDERYDAHDHHGHYRDHRGQLVFVVEDVNETKNEYSDHVNCEGDEEHEEVSVVPPSDTVVDPGTMVIEDLDAVVTDTAVRAARRSVELTSDTPLHTDLEQGQTHSQPLRLFSFTHRNTVDLDISIKRSSEVIVPVLIRAGARDDPRVHEGGHGEVDQDEDGDDALEYWNSIPMLDIDIPLVTPATQKTRSYDN